MSRYIATRAIRGSNALVAEAEAMLNKALVDHGPDTPVSFPNTAYYLPMIFGMTGNRVETLGQLQPALEHARALLHPLPSEQNWTPYLGETLDSGMATLFAAETIEAIFQPRDIIPEIILIHEMTSNDMKSALGRSLPRILHGQMLKKHL